MRFLNSFYHSTFLVIVFLVLICNSANPLVAAEKPLPDLQITKNSTLHFATKKEAIAALSKKDIYLKSMSAFDRQLRLKTDKPIAEKQYIASVTEQVRQWEAADRKKISAIIEKVKKNFSKYELPFPKRILLIKTSGQSESGAAYCREANIILPINMLKDSSRSLGKILIHELFHVLSNQNATLRDKLYKVIHFQRCKKIELPKSLQDRKITNPDAPVIEHYVTLKKGDQEIQVVPILISKTKIYDVKSQLSLFSYMQFFLMQVEEKEGEWTALLENGKPRLFSPRELPSYLDKIGLNTGYIIHPEEVLADNFVLLVQGNRNVRTPKILTEMEKILKVKTKTAK